MSFRKSSKEPSEIQAEFLSGDTYAFVYNGRLMRLMSSEEMTAAFHIKCGDENAEWFVTPEVLYVHSAGGNVFNFEKLL